MLNKKGKNTGGKKEEKVTGGQGGGRTSGRAERRRRSGGGRSLATEGELGFSLFKFRQCSDAICEVVSSENECIRVHVRDTRERQSLEILSP